LVRTSKPILEIRGLRKSFGKVPVLQGVDLTVSEGEILAVIGPSGSGKSTLLRCLNHLEQPDGGDIIFEGKKITADTDLCAVRTRMGMVFQHFNLFTHFSVLGNITEGPIQVLRQSKAEAQAHGLKLLKLVGLEHKAEAFPGQLSGGQKQRVAIARALAMNPSVLLLDEITSALDPELVGEVLQVIRRLAREGMTMLLVTHEMGFARETATRVIFMDHGQIIETGEPSQIFGSPQHPRLRQFLKAVLSREVMAEATGV
jgi:ABC-type polar amino acid transport system ATPase subunit